MRSTPDLFVAISRDLKRDLNLRYGDKCYVAGRVCIVADLMSKRIKGYAVDIMVSGKRHFRIKEEPVAFWR